MKLEVGMYCYNKINRKLGIGKIINFQSNNNVNIRYKNDIELVSVGNLIASHNIVDLIKHKDIILGNDGKLYQCCKVYKDYVFTYSKNKQGLTITLVDYQIDRIMCYEQFEKMSYKKGDSNE